MRLQRMVIAGFRGFADEVEFDLDADVVLVVGPNGSGKTSFFDAILWGLTGAVPRIGENASIVNHFARFGEARVEVHLGNNEGASLEVVRRFDGSENLTTRVGNDSRSGTAAQAVIHESLWPDGQASGDPTGSFSQSFTKSVYLEQDRVSEFVQADDEQKRFNVVGEIVGAGRLGELNRQLEAARRAWTQTTNRIGEGVQPYRRKMDQIEGRLAAISGAEKQLDVDNLWRQWVSDVSEFVDLVSFAERPQRRAAELDLAVRMLGHEQRRTEAQAVAIERLMGLVDDPPPVLDASAADARRLAALTEEVRSAGIQLQRAQETAAAARRERLAETGIRQSNGALAQLALRHLGDTCPVCAQIYDRPATVERLERLIDEAELAPGIEEDSALNAAADRLQRLEVQLGEAQARFRESELISSRRREWESLIASVASDAGLPDGAVTTHRFLETEHVARLTRLQKLRELRTSGELLSVSIARLAEAEEATGLREQLSTLVRQVREIELEVRLRNQAADDAHRLHDAIRSISESLVESELRRIEPLLQRIYSAIDPHPEFRAVGFLTKTHRGRGRLWTTVAAPLGDDRIIIDEPRTVLSSSQLNVLAVSTFLALNLSIGRPPLATVVLDDPLQSLDNVNLLGLSDLLRRLRGQRQVILSTHDDRLAGLLKRKLRPIGGLERTISISLTAWDRRGPQVVVEEVPREEERLRLVSG